MSELVLKIGSPSDREIVELETLRYMVDKIKHGVEPDKSFYATMLKRKNLICITAKLDDKIIGGAYFGYVPNYVVLEKLFVRDDYQKSDYRVGSSIVELALDSRPFFEEQFRHPLSGIMAEYTDSSRDFYYKLKFRDSYTMEGEVVKHFK